MSLNLSNNLIFDRNLLSIRRAKAANSLTKANFLIKRSFADIQEKLSEMNREFPMILNLGNGYSSINGSIHIITDEENPPFATNQFNLIISILNLHLVNDLPGCLIRLKDSLKPNGILIASLFGGDNLPQLRETLIKTELQIFAGISPRINPSIEIKQLGGLLQRAGFTSPVIDRDCVEVHYKNPIDLLHDLQNMSETNILIGRNKKYLGKKFWQKFSENYRHSYRVNEKEVSANFEILTLMAIKP